MITTEHTPLIGAYSIIIKTVLWKESSALEDISFDKSFLDHHNDI
mgnify:CR=1